MVTKTVAPRFLYSFPFVTFKFAVVRFVVVTLVEDTLVNEPRELWIKLLAVRAVPEAVVNVKLWNAEVEVTFRVFTENEPVNTPVVPVIKAPKTEVEVTFNVSVENRP